MEFSITQLRARCRSIVLVPLLMAVPAATASTGASLEGRYLAPSGTSCRDIVPERIAEAPSRPIGPKDLLEIRDFGSSAVFEGMAPGFAISPDGRALVVQVRRAEAETNSYCQAVLLYDLRDSATPPRILSLGGEFVREHIELNGLQSFPTGMSSALTPKWSLDGRWIAFLRRENGDTRLQIASSMTGEAVTVSGTGTDVVDFEWDAQGSAISFEATVTDSRQQERNREEGRSGYRYDSRFWMLASTEPFEERERKKGRYRVSLPSSGAWENALAESAAPSEQKDGGTRDVAFIETDAKPLGAFQTRVHARVGGRTYRCPAATCASATTAWFSPASKQVVFLRREGFANATTGIYAWSPGADTPRKVGQTDDAFTGCQLTRNLICGRETSLRPRDIVEIDLLSGNMRTLVDLNPKWVSFRPGRVTRLRWINQFGLEAVGDLVLPTTVATTRRYPLVVVQYDTRGFLRGGTGDEYPIQAMVAAGFAVLSVSRPMDYQIAMARAGQMVSQHELITKRLDRASAHSSLIEGIRNASQVVPIDSAHIAITGLSDGASTATYALIHSKIFSLALISTCCEDPQITMTSIGPNYERRMETRGYEFQLEKNWPDWKQASLAMNADRICGRVVIQTADREARMALASYAALKRAGVDIEMFIIPEEHHIKWQPAHRWAIYQRSLSELEAWYRKPRNCCAARR